MRRLLLLVTFGLLLAPAACGDDDGDVAAGDGPAVEQLSVTNAATASFDGPVKVRVSGNLYVDGDSVRLCNGLMESFPPQCAAPFIQVEGLDLAAVPGVQRNQGIAWTDGPYEVTGTLEGGILTVDSVGA